jgi:hypothetical protein
MRFLFLLWLNACWHVLQRWMFCVSCLHTRQGRWMGMVTRVLIRGCLDGQVGQGWGGLGWGWGV